MSAHNAHIAIVGAGVSGLYAAYLLQQRGLGFTLFEARDRVGGRIRSPRPAGHGPLDRFDLGATWYWPALQTELDALVAAFGLSRVAEHQAGDMLIERPSDAMPMRVAGYAEHPPSVRLGGGMASLVDALQERLQPTHVRTLATVRRLRAMAHECELDAEDARGQATTWRAKRVLLALPPRLAAAMDWTPALPPDLATSWHGTPTWMAPHAKYLAVYEKPFWRQHGLSGAARSARGPLAEIHDASAPGGSAALFGFFGVPAQVRMTVAGDTLRQLCRAQLGRLFGPSAASPRHDFIHDWAADSATATLADLQPDAHHAQAPPAATAIGPWAGRVIGIGSEWSASFPGYVAGAIEAARLGVDMLLRDLSATT